MNLNNKYKGYTGIEYNIEYFDADSFNELDPCKCTQTYGVCFYEDKMLIVFHGTKKHWGLVGGTIEKGETFEETLIREIQEESNMKVLSYLPIGYQRVTDTRDDSFVYQLRYVCKVEPIGAFASDPAGSITEIKLIDPKEYKKYFDWGTIGERIIERAVELKGKLS